MYYSCFSQYFIKAQVLSRNFTSKFFTYALRKITLILIGGMSHNSAVYRDEMTRFECLCVSNESNGFWKQIAWAKRRKRIRYLVIENQTWMSEGEGFYGECGIRVYWPTPLSALTLGVLQPRNMGNDSQRTRELYARISSDSESRKKGFKHRLFWRASEKGFFFWIKRTKCVPVSVFIRMRHLKCMLSVCWKGRKGKRDRKKKAEKRPRSNFYAHMGFETEKLWNSLSKGEGDGWR